MELKLSFDSLRNQYPDLDIKGNFTEENRLQKCKRISKRYGISLNVLTRINDLQQEEVDGFPFCIYCHEHQQHCLCEKGTVFRNEVEVFKTEVKK